MADVKVRPPEDKEAAAELGEPNWDVARLWPFKGSWSEGDYWLLPNNQRAELSEGSVEVLPMPTRTHQRILFFLARLLAAFAEARDLGEVLTSGIPVRLWEGKVREPDVVFMRAEHAGRMCEQHWQGADLVMEVVSPENRQMDLEIKRQEYAQAGIPEYWIVDPQERRITVLVLDGSEYRVSGGYGPGAEAVSVTLEGFQVAVDAVFAAGK